MKPAIFNTDMVRAILDDRKTNTRRPFTFKKCIRDYVKSMGQAYCLKHQDKLHGEYDWSIRERSGVWADYTHEQFLDEYAPYKKGDIIYVRETFVVGMLDGTMTESEDNPITVFYKADNSVHGWINEYEEECNIPWKPSIHMPKEYARLFLRVKDVRIERLNEISEEDCIKEGILQMRDGDDRIWFYPNTIDPLPLKNNTIFYKDYSREGYAVLSATESFKSLWESIYGDGSFNDDYVWVIEFEVISKEKAYE